MAMCANHSLPSTPLAAPVAGPAHPPLRPCRSLPEGPAVRPPVPTPAEPKTTPARAAAAAPLRLAPEELLQHLERGRSSLEEVGFQCAVMCIAIVLKAAPRLMLQRQRRFIRILGLSDSEVSSMSSCDCLIDM